MPNEKKEKSLIASMLAELVMQPINDERTALVLTDIKGKESGFVIGPEGLNVILAPLLSLARKWAHLKGLSIGTLVGPRLALPASRVVLEQGRDATECALRVFVGKVEFSFLIPLKAVVDGMVVRVPKIEKERGH